MILTCPECASRYVVDDSKIGPEGRTVRCASCGGSWRATPTVEPPLELEAAAAAPAPAPKAEAEPAPPPRPAAAALPKKIRAKTRERTRTRQALAAGAMWGALGAMVVAVLAGAALFRVDVVRLWPRTAGAYARVGLTVNPTGLAPENVQAAPGLKNGHAAVIVTGLVRNVETRPHDPAPLRVSLLDKHGKTLAAQTTSVAPGKLAPGQTRPFSVAFLDPPTAGADVQVEFALDTPKPHAGPMRVAAETHPPKLRGPAAAELPPAPEPKMAEQLPADSPYALPEAAHGQGSPDAPHEPPAGPAHPPAAAHH